MAKEIEKKDKKKLSTSAECSNCESLTETNKKQKKYHKDIEKTRPIYAAMLHWKTCKQLIWNARKKRNILIDYKYPTTPHISTL